MNETFRIAGEVLSEGRECAQGHNHSWSEGHLCWGLPPLRWLEDLSCCGPPTKELRSLASRSSSSRLYISFYLFCTERVHWHCNPVYLLHAPACPLLWILARTWTHSRIWLSNRLLIFIFDELWSRSIHRRFLRGKSLVPRNGCCSKVNYNKIIRMLHSLL